VRDIVRTRVCVAIKTHHQVIPATGEGGRR
jgi:hypothetical protein